MSRITPFRLPDLGEGLIEAEVLKWFVQPGDQVRVNQPLAEVETAKATVELPCPYSGVVTALHAGEGDTVEVGATIIEFDTEVGEPTVDSVASSPTEEPANASAQSLSDTAQVASRPDSRVSSDDRRSVLVGYGPKVSGARRRKRKPSVSIEPISPEQSTQPTEPPPTDQRRNVAGEKPVAKPPVRKLAKDLGVDLGTVTGSGPAGSITRSDVSAAVAGSPAGSDGEQIADDVMSPRWDDSGQWRIPIRGIRKHTAAAMVSSAFTAPHATEFVSVDVTPTLELRAKIAALPEFANVKVTPLLFVARAMLLAIRRYPAINSSWDGDNGDIVVSRRVNLGIAVATRRGLLVPNIKDAEQLSLRELATAIERLVEIARASKTAPADLRSGTISITNVGIFGVDTGTPILNPPEAAILALGSIRKMPWVVDDNLAVRDVTQLALSFDHRVVDGELASRFLSDIAAVLSDPSLAVAWT